MLTATAYGDPNSNFERYYTIVGIDKEAFKHAKVIFTDYSDKGVIVNKNFDDDTWTITNRVIKTTILFAPNELVFERKIKNWLGCDYSCFVDSIKVYVIFQMGSLGITSIRAIADKLMSIVDYSANHFPVDKHVIEFLKLLPSNKTKDRIIEDMEEQLLFIHKKQFKGKQRVLSDFENYFEFNSVLENFWQTASNNEKLFYFPIYFWWTLTSILPLRPTEFLLTPRQCLEVKNSENILTVRRSSLKGGQNKVHYMIEKDYRLMKYAITDKMAADISWYLDETAKEQISELHTLFIHPIHYLHLGWNLPVRNTYYTYQNLSYCLKYFYDDVMKVSDEKRINLGDTRHLAMISLIASGSSPVVCKELAGHTDISISSHYYSNISRFVECATYEMYKKQYSHSADIYTHNLMPSNETVDVDGGRCDSKAYILGDISDCVRNIGTDGELGHCIYCPHFIDGKSGKYIAFADTDEKKSQVDADSKYLIRVLELVRKGKGCNEDIQSALLKLQHSSSHYSQCLYKNMGGL